MCFDFRYLHRKSVPDYCHSADKQATTQLLRLKFKLRLSFPQYLEVLCLMNDQSMLSGNSNESLQINFTCC